MKRLATSYKLFFGVFALGIAVVSFSGIFFKEDVVGRFVFGLTWTSVALWQLGQFVLAKRNLE